MKLIGMETSNYNETRYIQCETMEEYNDVLKREKSKHGIKNGADVTTYVYETSNSSKVAGKVINTNLEVEIYYTGAKFRELYAKPSTNPEIDREVKAHEVYGGYGIITYKEKGIPKQYYGVGHKTFNTKKEAKKYIDE